MIDKIAFHKLIDLRNTLYLKNDIPKHYGNRYNNQYIRQLQGKKLIYL